MTKKTAIPLVVILLASLAGLGWFLRQGKPAGKETSEKAETARHIYTCTMHPFIIRDKPGSCPICGMELVRKIEAAPATGAQSPEEKQAAEAAGNVALSSRQRVMANVATVEAKMEQLDKEISAVGVVQYDQSRQAKVTAWVAGRIDKLDANTVGANVSKGRPVAELYSPDLVATQEEYLLAVRSRDQLRNSPIASISRNGDGLVASAKQRLLLLGVREAQIVELERSGRPSMRLPIFTPLSGVVIEKMVQQGQYVSMGEVLLNIADLSSVWVELEVYENEFSGIHAGQQVQIRSQSFPGSSFSGRVALIYPFLDPKTRTVKVRVTLSNPGMKLKPDMFVNAIIRTPLPPSIVVPVTAVMDTGKRQVVWVESSPGTYEARNVVAGDRVNDRVRIVSGLNAGEKVVVSGGYLIDSESQLRGGGGGHENMPGMKMDGHSPAAPARNSGGVEAPAAPAEKGGQKMDTMNMQ
jgi:Cu(I)/Ag(I) efflux system membrane fusion protein